MNTLQEIAQERAKQIAKGFTAEHDDTHANGEIAAAAAATAHNAAFIVPGSERMSLVPEDWPWSKEDWERIARHPRRQVLVIATALLVAEIERIDRAESRALGVEPFSPYRENEPPKDLAEAADRVAAKLKDAIGYLNECEMIHNSKCNNGGTPYPNGAEEAVADYELFRFAQANGVKVNPEYLTATHEATPESGMIPVPRTLHGYHERTWRLKRRVDPVTQLAGYQWQFDDNGEPKSPVFNTQDEAEAFMGSNMLDGKTISITPQTLKPDAAP